MNKFNEFDPIFKLMLRVGSNSDGAQFAHFPI